MNSSKTNTIILTALIFSLISCNPTTEEKNIFYKHIKNNNIDSVEIYIEQGMNVNTRFYHIINDLTPLMVASDYGHLEIVRLLVENGAKINKKSDNWDLQNRKWTALMFASAEGYTDIVKYLHKHGAKINIKNDWGGTALMIASKYGQKDIVEYLCNNEAKINLQSAGGTTALMLASKSGHIDIVKFLLEEGASVRHKYTSYMYEQYKEVSRGKTALMFAADKGHKEIIELLIEYGADIDAHRETGESSFIIAVQKEDTTMMHFLLEKGANINFKGKDGKTALMEVIELEKNWELVRFLIEHNEDVNVKDTKWGWTAIMYATNKGQSDAVILLIENGADLTLTDIDGQTVFDIAKKFNKTDILELLNSQSSD